MYTTAIIGSIITPYRNLTCVSPPTASVITVLTQLGAGLGYCFYLIKRIAIEYIETLTFKEVVYIICKVLSQLFRHLMQIQFGSLLKKIGGWVSQFV